jgi:hypothetical protein
VTIGHLKRILRLIVNGRLMLMMLMNLKESVAAIWQGSVLYSVGAHRESQAMPTTLTRP